MSGRKSRKKIFSPYLIFRKTVGEREKETLSAQHYLKEKLTSEQELIYNLVDGTRTVQDIIDRSLLGKFNASEILMNLLEMGFIEVVGSPDAQSHQESENDQFQGNLHLRLLWGLLALGLSCPRLF